MRNKKAYQTLIAAALLLGSFSGVPAADAAAKEAVQVAQEEIVDKPQETDVRKDAVFAEKEEAPIERKAIVLPKAPPSYNIGYFFDSLDARWATNKAFPYNPDNVYKIYCQPGYITDIALHPGDTITYAGAGDTVQWVIDKAEANGAPHMYIKPAKQGINTNLVINTDRHSYQLLLASGDWHLPMVSWSYRVEAAIAANQKADKEKLRAAKENQSLSRWKKNLLYEMKAQGGKSPEWMPKEVYDDGQKTFILFNDLSKTMPVLFINDKKQLKPANYRVKDNCFIVDGVFKKAALQTTDDMVWIANRGDKGE